MITQECLLSLGKKKERKYLLSVLEDVPCFTWNIRMSKANVKKELIKAIV